MQRNAKLEDLLYLFGSLAQLKECITATEELFGPKNTLFPELTLFAPEFFALTQRLLTSEVFISLSRILDGRTDVLSLEQLIDRHIKSELKDTLLAKAKSIKEHSSHIIKQRHKTIAHLDYRFAKGELEFTPIEHDEVNEIVSDIERLLKDIQASLFPSIHYVNVRGQLTAEHVQEMLSKIKSANDANPPYSA